MARERKPERALPCSVSSLGTLGDLLGGARLATTTPEVVREPETETPRGSARPVKARTLLARREKKGHGGKTVTTLVGHGLEGAALEDLARRLRKTLGCGSSVDGETLLLQGDQTARIVDALAAEGMKVRIG